MIDRFNNSSQNDEGGEDWLGTFADMVSLLLAFFIMLVAMSKIDPAKFEQMSAGMVKELANKDVEKPIEALQVQMADMMAAQKIDQVAGVRQEEGGLVVEFPAQLFFRPASAELSPEAVKILADLAKIIKAETYRDFQVDVQGHTDDTPISTVSFPSNWELSAARASAAARFLIEHGIQPHRLSATGMADTRPRVNNRDAQGRPVTVNQMINRRLEIRVFPR